MSARSRAAGQIVVLAGTNGAGKSSVAGAALRSQGGEYFNPDEATRRILDAHPALSLAEANSWAWRHGTDRLRAAVAAGDAFAFETTLGGKTITGILLDAARAGTPVRVVYVGLESVDLHLERVRQRVARGGHDIPEDRVRQRYDSSRRNLIRLLPHLAELKVFDNSTAGDPGSGRTPKPALVIHIKGGRVMAACRPDEVPEWAKPIVAAAYRRPAS